MAMTLSTLWPIGFLAIAVADDLYCKKFHNAWFIVLSIVGLFHVTVQQDLGLLFALGGFATGAALMLPLVLIGAIGAGDMKFMMCFGLLIGAHGIFNVFIYALIWGALIGILQVVFAGRLILFLQNLEGFAYKLKPTKTHKIPYTVAILFGWLTHTQWQGGLL